MSYLLPFEIVSVHLLVVLIGAAYLARAGKRVLVLESRARVGGACTIEEPFPGVRMSPCAYLAGLLHPLVVDELDLPKRGFHWTPAVNGMFVPFLDGSSVQLWDDDDACEEEIRRFAPRDVNGWKAMTAVVRLMWRATCSLSRARCFRRGRNPAAALGRDLPGHAGDAAGPTSWLAPARASPARRLRTGVRIVV